MSAVEVQPQEKGGLAGRDSAGFEWEDIPQPYTPSERAHLIPPTATASFESPRQLCGYLNKLSTKGPIKSWKNRWCVFDDLRCCLYYYNSKTDFTPQGLIDISNATLTYNVENLPKFQFEICVPGRIYSLQATSKDAMFYWLDALQKKRRKFSAKRKKAVRTAVPGVHSAGGLVGEGEGTTQSTEEEEEDPPQQVPAGVEDLLETDHSGNKPGFSSSIRQRMSSFSQKFRPTITSNSPHSQRRSNFYIEPPIHEANELEGATENSTPQSPDGLLSTQQQKPQASRNLVRKTSFATDLLRKVTQRTGYYSVDVTPCPHCQQMQETVSMLESEVMFKDREVKDRDEINEFLRNEIRMSDMRAKVKEELMVSAQAPNEKKVDVLLQREQTIAELQRLLEEAINEKDRVKTELGAKRCELEALAEQVDLFREAVQAKDHVVVELTNKLFQLENKGQIPTDPQDAMLPISMQALERELEKMKETVEAYRHQNQFLSSEILELNTLRAEDMETYRNLISKYHEMEAKYFKVQSKYMILLHEAQEPRLDTDVGPSPELVSQMLEEALGDEQLRGGGGGGKDRSGSMYDQYGFSQAVSETTVEPLLKQKARILTEKAQRVTIDESTASHQARWDNFMSSFAGGREVQLQRSAELKSMIRSGIPNSYRARMWKWIVRDTLGKRYVPGQYQAILSQYAGQSSVAINQIELDLLRTLPTNKYYDKPDAQGIGKLRRVLVAFSWYDSTVGYCQGLNRLAAIALLFLAEEEAFWCIVAIVHFLLPTDYYDRTLLGSQTDQRVLRDLLKDKAPLLSQHLIHCDIDFSLVTFNWFHTVFVDNLPVETMLRIWDTFLYEGSKVLFRFAIAIFKYNEETLLSMDNSITIFNRLRTMCQDATNISRLVQIGFNEINPFPMRNIVLKRSYHKQQIKAELEEIESVRSSQGSLLTPQTNKEVDSDDET